MSAEHGNILEKLVPGEHLLYGEEGKQQVDIRNVITCVDLVTWLFAATDGQVSNLCVFIQNVERMVRKVIKRGLYERKFETILIRGSLAKLQRHLKKLRIETQSIQDDKLENLDFWSELLKAGEVIDKEDLLYLEGKELEKFNPIFKVIQMPNEPFEATFDEKELLYTLKNQQVDEEDLVEKLKYLSIQEREDNRDSVEKQALREKMMENMRDINDVEFKELTSF